MSRDVEAGTVIDGRFELDERIGSGGLATVWRAADLETGWPAAVKCENVGVHGREQVRAHFRRELRWFRRFEGGPTPGSLVHFLDGSVRDGTVYVATELIGGDSLDAMIADDSPDAATEGDSLENADGGGTAPGLETFRSVGGPVCRALAFLHHGSALHLDLKPSNVLCRRRGPPAVIDLNSAVSTAEETETLFHHDPFKPPELTPTDARDERVGPWSDVYALGKLLVFLLTGEATEFDDPSLAEWHAVDPRSHGVECSPELSDVLRRATAPHPRERFDDAADLYASLVPFLDESDRMARLVHEPTGRSVRVHHGTSFGRWTADRRVPSVLLPDDERFVSPEHATFEHDGEGWLLRDLSLNGTFVRTDGGREYVLSRSGRERHREAERTLPRANPDESIRLSDGDRIDPVSPRYGCTLLFRAD